MALLGYLIVATPIVGDATVAPVKLWEPLTKTVLYAREASSSSHIRTVMG